MQSSSRTPAGPRAARRSVPAARRRTVGGLGTAAWRRSVALTVVMALSLAASGCSVARRANEARGPGTSGVPAVIPTVVAPPQAEGLNGTSGAGGPSACTAVAASPVDVPTGRWVAGAASWNDGGLPALDLCVLTIGSTSVLIGVSALTAESTSLERIATAAGMFEPATKLGEAARVLGPGARTSGTGVVFVSSEHVVRITTRGGITAPVLLALATAVHATVPTVRRPMRQTDAACQLANASAERFVGTSVQLRRDYRVDGALTCVWGTFDATVAIVESTRPDSIPEARFTPPPQPAPIGSPGYYLPTQGELVFRQGRRVVRVTALTDPAREIPLETLLGIVEPMLPLFLR